MSLYEQFMKALKRPGSPTLFLDLDAFEKNLEWIKENSGGKKIRVASKSVRSKEILKRILSSDSVFQGLMTFDLREALWLRQEGFNDILMGYPSLDSKALEELSLNPEGIILMVDLPEHLKFLQKFVKDKPLSICLDIDLSLDLPGLRFGVFRSQVTSEERLKVFLEALKECPGLHLKGLMGYEAQIAGVMDKHSPLIRLLKKISIRKLRKRRAMLVTALEKAGHKLELINGGGTGSLADTREEVCVTEITVGSGFYAPVLFDHYKKFKLHPALAFTLPVVRKPEPGVVTCLGGGYIASGSIEKIKQPTPYLPEGVKLLKHEGAGEVQTPLMDSGHTLSVGDSVIMRHAKAGEVCERFHEIVLVRKDTTEGSVLTYRGEGKTFI